MRSMVEGYPTLKNKTAVSKARQLRREMTLPEVLLWRVLRGKATGVRFRRQHPLGRFILDFYCPDLKLAIEIDGIAHDMGDRPQRDEARDAWLTEQGIRIIRIPATDVLKDATAIADTIRRICAERE